MKRIGWIACLLVLMAGAVMAQESEVESSETVSLKDYQVPKRSAVGIRFGYFNTIAASYQQFVGKRSAIDVNFGYRPTGGFPRWAENFTRVGGHVTYQHMYPLDVRKDGTIMFFWAVGWHGASVDLLDLENGRGFQTGPLAGVGLDLRMKNYAINLSVLPGLDLPGTNLDQAQFFVNKGSGIAVRLLF